MKIPSLNGLRAFEVSARHLNFRLAAEELSVTQGAVAQKVRALEKEIGIHLFDRLPRGLALTSAGTIYAEKMHAIFSQISEATENIKPQPMQLTLSVTPTFASKWLLPRLPDFTKAHPDIDLIILATDRLSNLATDNVDIALRYSAPPFSKELNAVKFLDHSLVAAASPILLTKIGDPQVKDNFVQYQLLHDIHDAWPQFIDTFFDAPHPNIRRNLHFNQTSLAIDAALAGQGIVLTSFGFIKQDLDAGRLALAFNHQLLMEKAFYIVYLKHSTKRRIIEKVKDWIISQ